MESTVVEICKLAGPWGILALAAAGALTLAIKSYTRIQLAKILAAAGGGSLSENRLGGMTMHIGKVVDKANSEDLDSTLLQEHP